MERKAKLVCSVVGFLGLLSAVLSFAAEGTKTTIHPTPDGSGCVFPSSPAVGLGFAAAVVLSIAQAIINATAVLSCCIQGCSCRSKFCSIIWAVISFVVSWSIHAPIMDHICHCIPYDIIYGALSNQQYEVDNLNFGDCSVLPNGVFGWAAVLSLTSLALGIFYYLVVDSTKIRNGSWGGTAAASNQSGIAIAQPQFPPPDTEGPVYTYTRRQFT